MGHGAWSDDTYKARTSYRKSIGSDGFDYHKLAYKTAAETGEKVKVHKNVNIKGVELRESRDSVEHPESLAISVIMDVTGSMRKVPKLLQEKLKTIMALLIKKGYVDHPQIMYGAIGDHYFDDAPVQIGQWESGIEQDDSLTSLILEGGGGDGLSESHGLSMYYLARHTAMDCLEKRGQKGYLFIITDEPPYTEITRKEVEKHIGDTLQANLKLQTIVDELNEKFNVFILIPTETANHANKEMLDTWKDLYGQNVVQVKTPAETAEVIASLIGLAEGKIDINDLHKDLADIGVDKNTVNSVVTALTTYAGTSTVVKRDKASIEGNLPAVAAGSDDVSRL